MVLEIPPPKLYPSGAPFVKYSADGGSFSFYPSGRMAGAYERMGGGFYAYFYADDRKGTTLLAIDPSGEGFCAFPNGNPRLTSRKNGGTFNNEDGSNAMLWTTSKPLRTPIEFDLSQNIRITFGSRQAITARLTCQGMSEDYQLGEIQKMATDSYLSKSIGQIKMGPERGKYILDVDQCRKAADENRQRREAMIMKDIGGPKVNITEDDMQKHTDLRPIVGSTSELQRSIAEGSWDVDCFISKGDYAKLSASIPSVGMDASMLKGDPFSRTLDSLAATKPDVLAKLLKPSDTGVDVLPLSKAISGASGRFRADHGFHYMTPRQRLKELKGKQFAAIAEQLAELPKNTMVVVCCLAGWQPQSRRVEPLLEQLNGSLLANGKPALTHAQTVATDKAASAASAAANAPPPPPPPAAPGAPPEFIMRKFDMSHSRALQEKYNINSVPMYLMYYGGQLAFAGNTVNGFGTSPADLRAQVRETTARAQRGVFLPADFKFGKTSDSLSDNFGATLSSTAPTLGKQ